jgi:hypothetical protein
MIAGAFLAAFCHVMHSTAQTVGHALLVKVDPSDGSYTIGALKLDRPVLHAEVAVQLHGRWIESKDYPHHAIAHSSVSDDLGTADEWTVTFSGLPGEPDLIYRLRAYPSQPFADIQVFVRTPRRSLSK